MSPLPHAFTVDTEDWAALMCMYLGRTIGVSAQFSSSIRYLLDLLDEYQTKATFYVIASHAVEQPAAVREIVARGHELGSHGWTHLKTHTFSPQSYREDIRRSVETLEELTGQKVYGHRCPFFSLLPGQVWALEAMVEAGLEYDSSMTSLVWEQAGAAVPEQPFVCKLPSGGSLVEFPALARKLGPLTARYIGGRGLRNLPRNFCVKHVQEREQAALPAILYLHTYEVMPDKLMQYVPGGFDFKSRLKLSVAAKSFEVGLGHMQRSIRHLLSTCQWAPAREVIEKLRLAGRLAERRLKD
jgi:peptidoglycan-N-acetylglucosamine deacetylase